MSNGPKQIYKFKINDTVMVKHPHVHGGKKGKVKRLASVRDATYVVEFTDGTKGEYPQTILEVTRIMTKIQLKYKALCKKEHKHYNPEVMWGKNKVLRDEVRRMEGVG